MMDLGDIHGSISIAEQVLEGFKRVLPTEHRNLQVARINLAASYIEARNYEAAIDLLEVALEILDRTPDYERLLRAQGWSNLGLALLRLGSQDEGIAILEEQARAFSEMELDGDEGVVRPQLILSAAYKFADRYAEAESLERSALEQARISRAPDDRDRIQLLNNVCWTEFSAGNSEAARERLRELMASVRFGLDRRTKTLAPRNVTEWAMSLRYPRNTLTNLIWLRQDIAEPDLQLELFELMETLRCAGARSRAQLRRSLPGPNELSGIREGSAHHALLASSGRADHFVRNQVRLDMLRSQLTASSSMLDELPAPTYTAVRDALAPGQALVGYFTIGETAEDSTLIGDVLLGYTITRDGSFRPTQLGPYSEVAGRVEAWREALCGTSGHEVMHGLALQDLVLAPLLEQIDRAERITFVLDGVLSSVPLDCLPVSENERLADRYEVHRRQSVWEMLLPETKRAVDLDLVAFGDIAFGDGEDVATSALDLAVGGAHVELMHSADDAPSFSPLPSTRVEIETVAGLLASTGATKTRLVTGARATRSEFERLAPMSRMLHVATHGWDASSRPEDPVMDRYIQTLSPMLLHGLALANANATRQETGRVEGILTAEELAQLDLRGCHLAVLSACESGAGLERSGHGVASLQAAVESAGAASSVASLWAVPDSHIAEFMQDFYAGISNGESRASALWKTKRKQMEQRRPPRGWAGWVLSGDAGPVETDGQR